MSLMCIAFIFVYGNYINLKKLHLYGNWIRSYGDDHKSSPKCISTLTFSELVFKMANRKLAWI
jgi:hypothetical protein